MAHLLHRIGTWAARHWGRVIATWLMLLSAAILAFTFFSGALTTAITIPGLPTNAVTQQLEDDFEGSGGGNGSVVFATEDGSAFTPEQIDKIGSALAGLKKFPSVTDAANPFEVQAQLAGTPEQIEQQQQATVQIEQGQAQIAAGLQQVQVAQDQLDQQRAGAEATGALEQVAPQLDAAQAQLDAQRSELEAQQAQLQTQSQALAAGAQLAELASGFRLVAEDSSAAVALLSFERPLPAMTVEEKEEIVAALTEADLGGAQAYASQDIAQAPPEVVGIGEVIGVFVAAVVLVIMLGTLIGAVLPLVSALFGVATATLTALSFSGVVEFQSVTPVLGIMLGLAVGIDYSLFILNRHRRQLKSGMPLAESLALANGTSGNAVVFAGATVVVALLALNMTGIPFLGLMGTVGAGAVVVAVLLAVTFTPALLSVVGMRILSKKEHAALAGQDSEAEGAAAADERHDYTPMSTLSAWIRLAVGMAILAVLALPALDMRLGLPDGGSQPKDSAPLAAFEVQRDTFGPGFNGPLLVVANLPEEVDELTTPIQQAEVGAAIAENSDVEAVVPFSVSIDGKALAFQVIPSGGPNDESTSDLVTALREQVISTEAGAVSLGVAGNASANIDVSQKLAEALPRYLLLVVGLSVLILILVFRSLLVPLTATLGYVLSLFAAFGGITAIFQWGWLSDIFQVSTPGPVISFLPLLAAGILFGLAMDYQLFLVSGMREAYTHGEPARVAVRHGLQAGRSVVTAAAIIMIAVFAGFIFSDDPNVKPIGFALALGVALDAFLVRMLIIPALMHLMADKAWWMPGWLDRLLPDVDVEGAQLEAREGISG